MGKSRDLSRSVLVGDASMSVFLCPCLLWKSESYAAFGVVGCILSSKLYLHSCKYTSFGLFIDEACPLVRGFPVNDQ